MLNFPLGYLVWRRRLGRMVMALALIAAGGVAVLLAKLGLPLLFVIPLAFIAGSLVIIVGCGLLLLWALVLWISSRDASDAR
jgi:hypothetical protein